MSSLDHFEDEKISLELFRTSSSLVDGKDTGKVTASLGIFTGVFYLAAQAKNLISEKLRAKVDAVLVMDYGIDIRKGDSAIIDSKNYATVNIDNVALQDDVIVIGLEEIN